MTRRPAIVPHAPRPVIDGGKLLVVRITFVPVRPIHGWPMDGFPQADSPLSNAAAHRHWLAVPTRRVDSTVLPGITRPPRSSLACRHDPCPMPIFVARIVSRTGMLS